MVASASSTPRAVREWSNQFLALWPHRYDFIAAPYPDAGEKPNWLTESRYPLLDRLVKQGGKLFGVRFGKTTNYCLLDIDADSCYHPAQDPFALARLKASLEPLGLVRCIICTSSHSGGLHLFFPFEKPQQSWKLASAVATALTARGFQIKSGTLEVFPNTKNYSTTGQMSLFNAHRLPLQEPGSHLLNDALEPIFSSREAFVSIWSSCVDLNDVSKQKLERLLKSKKRVRRFISQNADVFLNDLDAEIELGWTGRGQTNRLLGRITMRCYIFHHVAVGGQPLSGEDLVNEIISTAKALPGYKTWCRHQHEIRKRATDWARCIENSHYFPYGTQHGKYKAVREGGELPNTEVVESYNDQKARKAQERISALVEELEQAGQLPKTITARFDVLTRRGVGGRSLYRYKHLWHPKFNQQRQEEKSQLQSSRGELPYEGESSPQSTSLFMSNDGNSLCQEDFRRSDRGDREQGVGNSLEPSPSGELRSFDLEKERAQRLLSHQSRQADSLARYLLTGEYILVHEALQAIASQPALLAFDSLRAALVGPAQAQHLSVMLAVFQELVRLDWTPQRIQQVLMEQFGQDALSLLSMEQLHAFYRLLRVVLLE